MNYPNSIKLAVLALCLAGCGSGTTPDNPPAAELQEAEQLASTIYSVGDTVKAGDLKFTLTSIETKKAVHDPNWSPPAGPGETFVVARYEMKNLANKPISPFELPTVDLLDGEGTEYGTDIQTSSSRSDSSGWDDVNPGVIFKGTRSWKVVEDSYDPAAWTVVVRTDPQLTFRLK